jgi:folate-binding protein YgfZ
MRVLTIRSLHADLGATFGERSGEELVLRYADPEAEASAARENVALADLSYRGVLRVTGPDRSTFLHGMCTQDINGMPEGSWAYAALLTAKGAMVADARVLRRPDELLIDLDAGLSPKVLGFLNSYLISEDAEATDVTGEYARLALHGPRTAQVLAALGLAPPEGSRVLDAQLNGERVLVLEPALAVTPSSVELWVPPSALAGLWEAVRKAGAPLGLSPLGEEALELLRVEAGLPRYGQELVDTTIPLEANLQRALHYNKGCYIGQEVIARATFRGHMNRKLVGLYLGEAAPAAKTELFAGERKVGFLTSVVRSKRAGQTLALGYVHRDFLAAGTELSLASAAGKATVAALPFFS